MDDHKQAISFANSYFALIDGLAGGLESHFADDVLLDWFGRTVRGSKNVATFLNAHRKYSRHIFPEILASTGISYEPNRAESVSDGNEGDVGEDLDGDIADRGDPIYKLSEGDLSNLFRLEMTPTDVEEIERSINRIKLEEEMAPGMNAVERERGQGDRPVETSTIKFVEANGQIEFWPKVCNSGNRRWEECSYGTRGGNCRKRVAKLQVAYSTLSTKEVKTQATKGKKQPSPFAHPNGRLPSFEELGELSARLVPKSDDFDFFLERNAILRSLQTELALEDPQSMLLSPQYEEGKLVINKPSAVIADCDRQNHKNFIFNYKIHVIVYQGKSRCRMNLLQTFETSKIEEENSSA